MAKIIKYMYGKNQKCLVLDLDNTIWGGVIGDLGVEGIELGAGTPLGEAYEAFQKYVKSLVEKGIILAVCSKNDYSIAKEGFSHPCMVLKLEDISVFCADWNSKDENILKIAEQLNILPDSIVFIDDNPAERQLVRQALPEVNIVEADSVIEFITYIEEAGYFCGAGVSEEDSKRNRYYADDVKRTKAKNAFVDYDEYLSSLEMSSAIKPFSPEYYDRITQLINKTNQFNLTTIRYNINEIEKIANDENYVTLYATLNDKYGSNGIVSVLIGQMIDSVLHIRLWVMSCRVFQRGLELAVFDRLVDICKGKGLLKIMGYYYKTKKNGYSADLYDKLGFCKISGDTWEFVLKADYQYKNKTIKKEHQPL